MDDYDVFLNHRGPDVKGGFIAHLHDALRSARLNPFLDKKSLVKGDSAFGSIDAALKVARIHVAVVSRGYAESNYCLSELVVMMRSRKPVIPVFYDVEPTHLRRVENGPFAAAFEKHKSRETAEQVEEWADALGKLADITGFCFRLSDFEGDEAELKQKVVDAILSFMPRTRALQVECHLVGMEEHVYTCVNKLEKMSGAISILCLVGMGGIGKTSLAKEIYNHFVGCKKFQAMSFLEIDRNPPSSTEAGLSLLKRLQEQLLWDLLRVVEFHQSYEYWFEKLSRRGSVLVVLDDIHNKTQFDKLILRTRLLAPGSCIIVTSRDRHVLKKVAVRETNFYIHEVTPLGFDASQKLFNLHAFHNEEVPGNFTALAIDVIEACGGLPLALKVIGSSLFDKRSDEDRECIWPEAIDALKGEHDIMSALKWSYNCLSESAKLMFVDIACVVYGWKKEEALEIWKGCKKCSSCSGCGTPHTSLRELIDKSLVVLKKSSRQDDVLAMHGLLQDMGQSIGNANGSHLWEDKAVKVVEDKSQVTNKVRALNLANSRKRKFEAENFAMMTNLHYLILDGCDVIGNFGSISKELRLLRWRNMPMMQLPPVLDFSNLVSLDFSQSTILANAWTKSNPALEGCPNLLRLNLSECTSITTLPDSVGRLSMLQVLDLTHCWELQKLPSSIGQLTALRELYLFSCRSLEALPDTITALPGLQILFMDHCLSILRQPTSIGLMKSLTWLDIDLATEWQAIAIGQLNALEKLLVRECTDELITMLDSSGTLRNLGLLSQFWFIGCRAMHKLPETIGLLTSLKNLHLFGCDELKELPDSIGQLKALTELSLRRCHEIKTLPDSLGALTNLQHLLIEHCSFFRKLPTSIGHLSSLLSLRIEGCVNLKSLPASLSQLNALVVLQIIDCRSLEDLGLLKMLQGLRIWGCTSITEPPPRPRESCGSRMPWDGRFRLPYGSLMVLDSNFMDPAVFYSFEINDLVRRDLRELEVVEVNDCGFLRYVQDTCTRSLILQRVFKLPCCKLTTA